MLEAAPDLKLSVSETTERFVARFGADYSRPITDRWIGSLIRSKLNLKAYKSHGAFVVVPDEDRLRDLFDKYGIEPIAASRGDGDTGMLNRGAEYQSAEP